MFVWNSSKATYIYTVSITYFVLRFYERFFKTRSIIHVTGTNIYIYILEPVCTGLYGDAAELIHGFIGAWKKWISENSLTDIKYYLSHITKKSIQ